MRGGRQREAGDPHRRLVLALLEMAGPDAQVPESRSTPWASATFDGARHHVILRLAGNDAHAAAAKLADMLPEAEFAISGHIVADVAVDGQDHSVDAGHPCSMLHLSILTIRDW